MPFAETDDLRIYYETRGAGDALVLVPGFASGAWTWFRQTEDLAKNFQVITFDPRGVSHSQISDGTIVSMQKIASDITALLDKLKIERANVLGASFGGFVAQEFALRFPERIDKLVLACTSFGGENHVAPHWEILAAFIATDDLNKSERIRKFIVPAFTPEFYAADGAAVETVCRLREQNIVPEAVYMQQLQAATTFCKEDNLADLKAETLILTGDKDVLVPPQNSVNLARKIPNAQLEIIKGGSHMFFIENAAEFNRIVTEFLKA